MTVYSYRYNARSINVNKEAYFGKSDHQSVLIGTSGEYNESNHLNLPTNNRRGSSVMICLFPLM